MDPIERPLGSLVLERGEHPGSSSLKRFDSNSIHELGQVERGRACYPSPGCPTRGRPATPPIRLPKRLASERGGGRVGGGEEPKATGSRNGSSPTTMWGKANSGSPMGGAPRAMGSYPTRPCGEARLGPSMFSLEQDADRQPYFLDRGGGATSLGERPAKTDEISRVPTKTGPSRASGTGLKPHPEGNRGSSPATCCATGRAEPRSDLVYGLPLLLVTQRVPLQGLTSPGGNPMWTETGVFPGYLLRKGSPSRTNFVESNPHRDRSRGLPQDLVAERGPICSFSRFTRQYWVG